MPIRRVGVDVQLQKRRTLPPLSKPGPPRRRGKAHTLALAVFVAILSCVAPNGESRAQSLPTITTAHAAHSLSGKEAARGYPVHLRAVVTYYDADVDPRRSFLFAIDPSGSIFVAFPRAPEVPFKAGEEVEISGRSAAGDFAPIVSEAKVRAIGKAQLPSFAARRSMTDLLDGSHDGEWIEVAGVVRSIEETAKNILLEIAMGDGTITAATLKEPDVDYAALVDARITVRGNTGLIFNHRGQVTGAHLLFPGLMTVRIEQPAPADPFQQPVTLAGDLLRFRPNASSGHREHLRGAVSLFWPGRLLCLQDASGGLCAGTEQTTPLAVGEIVDVIGFPIAGDLAPSLAQASFKPAGSQELISEAIIGSLQKVPGDHDAGLVQVEGKLIEEDKSAADPTIIVSSGKFIFPVILQRQAGVDAIPRWEKGSVLRITGICSVQSDTAVRSPGDGFVIAKSFRILLRSPQDVVVLKRPSWWNAQHALGVLAVALAISVCILGWVTYLRVCLKRQTRLLHHQATHDSLTGIWNRKAVLDLLDREYAIAGRAGTQVGVMMLDADHFKQINDTHGHLAGDAVLRELPRRIQTALRATDLTGRYGGEEFLIVLPGCTTEQCQECAERVRAAIANIPINSGGGAELVVTVSVGTAVLDPSLNTQHDALAAADGALYKAKLSGRNRVVSGVLLPCIV